MCRGCNLVRYCSKECAIQDFDDVHGGVECDVYSKANGLNCDQNGRLLLRLLIVGVSEGLRSKQFKTWDGQLRTFNDLLEHREDIMRNDYLNMINFDSVKSFVKSAQFSNEDIESFFCKMRINSFVIENHNLEGIATGMYIATSIFDHSCEPNANVIFDGLNCQVRAKKAINTDYEKIFINYVNLEQTREVRRSYLYSNYFFSCNCVRCFDSSNKKDLIAATINKLRTKIASHVSTSEKQMFKLLLTQSELMAIYEKVYGINDPHITLELFKMVKNILEFREITNCAKNSLISKIFRQFVNCAQLTHGTKHSFYKLNVKPIENLLDDFVS